VCWKPCSSCWSFDLLREEFLLAPIHSPPLWFAVSVLQSSPDTRGPRHLEFFPAPRVSRCPRRTTAGSAPHGSPVRLVPLPVREPVEVPAVPRRHLHRHPVITGKPRPYLKAARPPSRALCLSRPPWPLLEQAPVLEPFRRWPTPLAPSLPHTRAIVLACWQDRASPLAGAEATAAAAAWHRRALPPVASLLQLRAQTRPR
jgi:hypothetical protein